MDDKKKERLLRLIIIAIAVIIGIGAIVLLVQAVQAIFFPVIGVAVVVWFVFGDHIAANWRANKQRQALEQQQRQQQQEVMQEEWYYRLLREVVKIVVEIMLGREVAEDLLIYRGPYIYGDDYFYYRWPTEIEILKAERWKELKSRLQRRLAQFLGILLAYIIDNDIVDIKPGHDGEILILIRKSIIMSIITAR